MNCKYCHTPLSGRADTYGPAQAPVCQVCWLDPDIVACPHCQGTGLDSWYSQEHRLTLYVDQLCPFCQGAAYMTWVQALEYDEYVLTDEEERAMELMRCQP